VEEDTSGAFGCESDGGLPLLRRCLEAGGDAVTAGPVQETSPVVDPHGSDGALGRAPSAVYLRRWHLTGRRRRCGGPTC